MYRERNIKCIGTILTFAEHLIYINLIFNVFKSRRR